MNRILRLQLVSIFLFLISLSSTAQSYSHFGLQFFESLKNLSADASIPLIIKADSSVIHSLSLRWPIDVKYHINDLYRVDIKHAAFYDFDRLSPAMQMQSLLTPTFPMMDMAKRMHRIDSVLQGAAPLTQAYSGEGTIIGFADLGIDFNHPDFLRPDGTSRIRYIWEQDLAAAIDAPLPYNYGQEWNWTQIDDGSCTHIEHDGSHGSLVAGVAASNGASEITFSGAAPKSELMMVSVNAEDANLSHLLDACDYVFKKADAMGKPAVMNLSMGIYNGSHDGLDLSTQMLEALLQERSGRFIVAAAGNAAQSNIHLAHHVSADSAFTWFHHTNSDGKIYFDLYADSADFNDVYFSVGNDDTAWVKKAISRWFNVKDDFEAEYGMTYLYPTYTLFGAGGARGTIDMSLSIEPGGVYHLEFLINPIHPTDLWRLITKGSGSFDCWSSNQFTGGADIIHPTFAGFPDASLVPEINTYIAPDNNSSVASGPACSESILTVGNFINKSSWIDINGQVQNNSLIAGQIDSSSGRGPDRLGRLKPDLSAAGSYLVAAANRNFILDSLALSDSSHIVDLNHQMMSGTSLAAPLAAACATLYFEKKPNAWHWEVKQVLKLTAYRDSASGSTENNLYGYGKIQIFDAMNFLSIPGCMDTAAFNYNPLANISNDSCIPRIFGCTDPLAVNYNPMANTDDLSCLYDTISDTLHISANQNLAKRFHLFPNPANEFAIFNTSSTDFPIQFSLFDNTGQLVSAFSLNEQYVFLALDNLSSGLYSYRFISKNGYMELGKLFIQ